MEDWRMISPDASRGQGEVASESSVECRHAR